MKPYYAPPEQQKEGLKFVTKQFTINQFEHACNVLVQQRWMTRSRKKKLLSWFREHIGLSYMEWRRKRRNRDERDFPSRISGPPPRGLWE
jgi:hypothetical protein